MNKLLVITVLTALLALSAESFRLPRDAEQEEGTLSKISGHARTYYDQALTAASGYLDSIKGLKIEEKAKNVFSDTTTIMKTYLSIMQDQIYHAFSTQ